MAVITYNAVDRGDLVSGHSEGTEYTIEIPFTEWTPRNKKKGNTVSSLSGVKHHVLHYIERSFSFRTLGTDDTNLIASLDELFSSVAAGEVFTIDPYGTVANPDVTFSVQVNGDHRVSRPTPTEFSYSALVNVEV